MEKTGKHASKHQALIRTLADPVAELTDWSPMSSGGSNFQMLEIFEVSGERIEFRRTRRMIRFYRVFMGAGLVMLGLAVFATTRSRYLSAGEMLYVTTAFALVGLLVGGTGVVMKRVAGRPSVLDRRLGWYWMGPTPRDAADVERRKDAVLIKDVHAVQYLEKWFERFDSPAAGSTSHFSYEINLVMHDGSRVNVVNHGGQSCSLLPAASRTARFLDVPLWDASS